MGVIPTWCSSCNQHFTSARNWCRSRVHLRWPFSRKAAYVSSKGSHSTGSHREVRSAWTTTPPACHSEISPPPPDVSNLRHSASDIAPSDDSDDDDSSITTPRPNDLHCESLCAESISSSSSSTPPRPQKKSHRLTPQECISLPACVDPCLDHLSRAGHVQKSLYKCQDKPRKIDVTPINVLAPQLLGGIAGSNNDVPSVPAMPSDAVEDAESESANGMQTVVQCSPESNHLASVLRAIGDVNDTQCDCHNEVPSAPLEPLNGRSRRRLEMLCKMQQADAAANLKTAEGSLHVAAHHGSILFIRMLLGAGANPNAFDSSGNTPLHYAVASGHLHIVSELLAAGADPTAQDHQLRTPLHHAASRCCVDIARILISHGSDPRSMDADYCTPLSIALKEGCQEVALAMVNRA